MMILSGENDRGGIYNLCQETGGGGKSTDLPRIARKPSRLRRLLLPPTIKTLADLQSGLGESPSSESGFALRRHDHGEGCHRGRGTREPSLRAG